MTKTATSSSGLPYQNTQFFEVAANPAGCSYETNDRSVACFLFFLQDRGVAFGMQSDGLYAIDGPLIDQAQYYRTQSGRRQWTFKDSEIIPSPLK
ncbi:hypothetical protein D5086_019638 [Populus alba]|uniref:Uncharacterized protein n=1 Tax=Populus alba TaxID=43335 RepID=A0ACC4BI53_POPAL